MLYIQRDCECVIGGRPRGRSTFQILRVSGSEDRGRGDNSIQFINIVRVGDKSFKERRQKIGGGRVGDNNILTFLCY